ncbi:MAG: hypothetical protein HDT43_04890 [Ruminococcaceae bacterium]|nr:hypothetical protein [Oscillospiraceae bacterium]
MENYKIRSIYNNGFSKMSEARTETAYREAKEIFDSIKNYKDSEKLAQKCDDHIKEIIYNRAVNLYKEVKTPNDLDKAKNLFETILGYKDADELLEKCKLKEYLIPYNSVLERMKTATQIEEFSALAEQFRSFGKLFEAERYAQICEAKKNKLIQEEERKRAERRQYQEEQINYVKAQTSLQAQSDERAKLVEQWRQKGVCQYCGGNFANIFNKKCSRCGKMKDY